MVVECLGASGVGKTTTIGEFQAVCKQNWLFDPITNETKSVSIFDKKSATSQCDYEDLLNRQVAKTIGNDLTFLHKASLVSWAPVRLAQDFSLFASKVNATIGIWFEDGILHNFSDVFLDLFSEGKLENIPLSRILILLDTDTDVIVTRLKKRSIETPNSGNNWYAAYGKKEIYQRVTDVQHSNRKLLKRWREHGGITHCVDATFADKAVSRLLKIEESLIKSSQQIRA